MLYFGEKTNQTHRENEYETEEMQELLLEDK